MATIAELLAGGAAGETKVTCSSIEHYFVPFFKDNDGYWHGKDMAGRYRKFLETDDWQPYAEPKPKKIVYEWMYRSTDNNHWIISTQLFTEEEAALVYMEDVCMKTGRQFEVEWKHEND